MCRSQKDNPFTHVVESIDALVLAIQGIDPTVNVNPTPVNVNVNPTPVTLNVDPTPITINTSGNDDWIKNIELTPIAAIQGHAVLTPDGEGVLFFDDSLCRISGNTFNDSLLIVFETETFVTGIAGDCAQSQANIALDGTAETTFQKGDILALRGPGTWQEVYRYTT
jgi:hypothetical protein